MGVEYLQKLDVGGDHINEVAFVPAFQLGGAKAAQSAKYLITDQRQQFEGDEVVTCLLSVTEKATHQCED